MFTQQLITPWRKFYLNSLGGGNPAEQTQETSLVITNVTFCRKCGCDPTFNQIFIHSPALQRESKSGPLFRRKHHREAQKFREQGEIKSAPPLITGGAVSSNENQAKTLA